MGGRIGEGEESLLGSTEPTQRGGLLLLLIWFGPLYRWRSTFGPFGSLGAALVGQAKRDFYIFGSSLEVSRIF